MVLQTRNIDMLSEMDRNSEQSYKSRKIQGACDVCKKRKIRCDVQTPGSGCTHCKSQGLDCTRADLTKALTSANGYVTALEGRVEKMERLLTELLPGIDFAEQLENENEVEPLLRQHVETLPRNDEELVDGLNKLKLNPDTNRFFGKSSGIQFVQTAFNFRAHLAGMAFSQMRSKMGSHKRDEFWALTPWQLPPEEDVDAPQYSFPEPDLLAILVGKYFTEVNPYWPVLHRPTFERKVADKLHLRDWKFANTLLMVCSLGARHSDDPRVLPEGRSGQPLQYAGWKWHSQVRVIPKHLIYKPDLYELQTIVLSAMYLRALSPTALCWTQVGFGLRRAQDVGAHRRRNQNHPTVENEHWKRVFWVLLCLERVSGAHTGRPLIMHYSDFDQDLPAECDDEYWDVPTPQTFKQPKDKPSDLSYFICYAKLLEIQADVITTLYSPRKPRDLCGRSFPPSESQCIMAFDSALNAWLNAIPAHLRWDPDRPNILHFKQSALLHAAYYNVQILVHRPFIPAPFAASPPGAVPSLAIASNAARLLVSIFDVYERRRITPDYPNLLPIAFVAGLVLLLSAWSSKKSSFTYSPSKELDQVHSCLKLTMAGESRYLVAGRYTDLLNRLLCAGDNLDRLFNNAIPVLPPSAQRGYETFVPTQRLDVDSTSQWPSPFTHQVGDFETVFNQMNAPLYSRLCVPEYQYPANGRDEVHTDVDATINNLDLAQMCGLELPVNIDTPLLPSDMTANADVMAMWSTAPSGFHVDEWSYIMSQDMSSPPWNQPYGAASETNLPIQTNLPSPMYMNPKETEKYYLWS